MRVLGYCVGKSVQKNVLERVDVEGIALCPVIGKAPALVLLLLRLCRLPKLAGRDVQAPQKLLANSKRKELVQFNRGLALRASGGFPLSLRCCSRVCRGRLVAETVEEVVDVGPRQRRVRPLVVVVVVVLGIMAVKDSSLRSSLRGERRQRRRKRRGSGLASPTRSNSGGGR